MHGATIKKVQKKLAPFFKIVNINPLLKYSPNVSSIMFIIKLISQNAL